MVTTISSIEKESIVLKEKDKSNPREELPVISPLRKLMARKSLNDPIEVRTLLILKDRIFPRIDQGLHSLYISSYW